MVFPVRVRPRPLRRWRTSVSTAWTTCPSFSSQNFLELCEQSGGKIPKVAVVEDIRGYVSYSASRENGEVRGEMNFLEDSRRILQDLRREGFPIEILFLECSDPILMRRYSETRRQHPLADGGSIWEGIRKERAWLQGIRDMANQVIDTSPVKCPSTEGPNSTVCPGRFRPSTDDGDAPLVRIQFWDSL